ncbi:MAG: DUF1343 domain-containing protein [Bacteroidales bacterium]|nr:DUF1343 domain-containing protein [Bacteroidales bacterium]
MNFFNLKNLLFCALVALTACTASASKENAAENAEAKEVVVGAARTEAYLDSLRGKRVALFSNHTGMVGDKHTLDILLENGINVVTLFSPEHGFRGTADAGEHVSSSVDPVTGIPIASLYGDGKKPAEVIADVDVVVSDIQDVGLRYYTYYCTMLRLMNEAAALGKEFVVLDRPNPNGMYVDGPILDMKYQSGVGRLPMPIVHGLTLGEMAQMIVGEKWLKDSLDLNLMVVPCENYTHQTRYELPIAPSPNLRTMKAIYLYPATCYFEATPVSLGRGTDFPFLAYGHPDMKNRTFEFTPRSVPGAKNPPLLDQHCYGVDLRDITEEEAIAQGVSLAYVIDAYNDLGMGDKFFTSFFEKLVGRGDIRKMIEDGMSAEEIKATWAGDVEKFKEQRRPYLLYAE